MVNCRHHFRRKPHRFLLAIVLPFVGLATSAGLATPVVMSGEEAFGLATKLVADGALGEAEAILRTLATGDPATFDMIQVDRLAAKIAFAHDDHDRAIKILQSVVEADPDNWRVRYDLAHVAMADRRDRVADRQLTALLGMDIGDEVRRKVRADRSTIADRRVMRLSMRASAVPSTNINSATSDEVFRYAGVVPFRLSDDARAQSGVGMNWSVGGQLTPALTPTIKAHLSVSSNLVDHSNAAFDQTSTHLEAGFRHRMARSGGLLTTLAATYTHNELGGEAYSKSVGARLSTRAELSSRTAVTFSLSIADVEYVARQDRNGHVLAVSGTVQRLINRWMQASVSASLGREDAVAITESNSRLSISGGLFAVGPWGTRLDVRPSVYFRAYDAASFAYGAIREDWTTDITLSIGHRTIEWGGFRPSLVYKHTDNTSTVDLFSYDRHAMDIAFARAF